MLATTLVRSCRPLVGLASGSSSATAQLAEQLTRGFSAQPAVDDHDLHANEKEGKVLHPHLLNRNISKTQYAVRGELYLRAEQLRQQGKDIIFTNGEHHAPPLGLVNILLMGS